MYKVQKGAGVPPKKQPGRRKYPYEKLGVGEMFFVPDRKTNNLMTHSSNAGKKLKRKFVTRLSWMRLSDKSTNRGEWEPCNENADGAVRGIGVWRTR